MVRMTEGSKLWKITRYDRDLNVIKTGVHQGKLDTLLASTCSLLGIDYSDVSNCVFNVRNDKNDLTGIIVCDSEDETHD